jgi:MoaA/NifB/PqqE/SkfB family radical SAM enzyme
VALRPRFLTYLVTFRCNARCVMCDSWRKPSANELTLSELAVVFEQLPRMDVVRLSGGEPFLRADLADIAQLAAEHLRPRVLHVTTNGFLTQRILRFCERRGRTPPLHLLISLDGTKAKHNEVRGRDTAWDSALATLCALAPRQRELGLRLAVNQTIVDPDGVREHRRLRELLRPLGVPVHAVVAYDRSATYSLQTELQAAPKAPGEFAPFGRFSADSGGELLTELEGGLAMDSWAERLAKRYYLDGLRSRLLHHVARPNPRCVALSAHLRLYPDGSVPVCQFNSRRVGHLRHESFASVWWGEAIRPQREWVRHCAGCWAECEVLPNAIYSGDLLRHAVARVVSDVRGRSARVVRRVRAGASRVHRPTPAAALAGRGDRDETIAGNGLNSRP